LSSEQIVASAKPLWAVVTATGSLARNNGVTSATQLSTGDYEVVFNRDVTHCAYAATLGSPDATDPVAGEVGVAHRLAMRPRCAS
jgi:hypothetical protein